jgi:dynein light chain 4
VRAALVSAGSGGAHRGRELTAEFLGELKKAFSKNIIKSADMNHELQSEAIDLIVSAIDKQRGNYEAAARSVKEQMDRKFGPSWHCIIGEGFGFQCTYQTKHMIFLYYQGNVAILLFKC